MSNNWELVVGNIGSVYQGSNGFEANSRYQTYVGQSKAGYGRAAGESVTLFRNRDLWKEYIGSIR
jgi:hypothetical protein